jgi:hypothetical protein
MHLVTQPLKRNDPGGEVGCCGSPDSGPCCAVTLRIHNIRPPLAPGSCGRREGESEKRLNPLKREHDDGGVAMFQVGVERAVLVRNVRRTLRQGKIPAARWGIGANPGRRIPTHASRVVQLVMLL